MREGYDNFLIEFDDQICGICFGCDFAAEHEWGIKNLQLAFGINEDSNPGIDRLKISRLPKSDDFRLISNCLVYLPAQKFLKNPQKPCEWLHSQLGENEIRTAWDGGTFAVVAFTQRSKAFLVELHEAFNKLDVAMWIGGAKLSLKSAGLIVCIASKIPDYMLRKMQHADIDHDNLIEESKATGIHARLEKAGLRYFALSPSWRRDIKTERSTKHSVVFWLNPMDQKSNNFGWFTVEDLEDWIEGKGRIVKEAHGE